jgi:hypothetical protein
MENVILKLLLIAYMLMPTGDVKVQAVVVEECPPNEIVTGIFDSKLKTNEIIGWNAVCATIPFGTKPFAKIDYNG